MKKGKKGRKKGSKEETREEAKEERKERKEGRDKGRKVNIASHMRIGIVSLLWGEALRPPPNPPSRFIYFSPKLAFSIFIALLHV